MKTFIYCQIILWCFVSNFELFAQDRLYWTNPQYGIISSNLDGSNLDTIFQSKVYGINAFDIDTLAKKIYWLDVVKLQIGWCDFDGGNLEILHYYGKISVHRIQYNHNDDNIYYGDYTNKEIVRVNRQGTSKEVVKTIEDDMRNSQLDFNANLHFFNVNQHLVKSTFSSLDRDTIFSLPSDEYLAKFVLDDYNQKIYLLSRDVGFPNTVVNIYRVNYDGTGIENIYSRNVSYASSFNIDFDIDPTNNRFYFSIPSSLFVAELDGSNVKFVGSLSNYFHGNLKVISKVNGYIEIFSLNKNINRKTINISNIDIPVKVSEEEVIKEIVIQPRGIAVDNENKKIYWTDSGTSTIQRANLDGSEIEVLVQNLINPNGIALDLNIQKMFWTDRGDNSAIYKANLDGTIKRLVLNKNTRSSVLFPEGIALDTANQLIYFTSQGVVSIYQSNYDGNRFSKVASPDNITHNLALDLTKNVLYWTEASSFSGSRNGIQRIQIGEPNGEFIYDANLPNLRGGIALDNTYKKIYWLSGNQLQSSDFNGNNFKELTIEREGNSIKGYLTTGATHAYIEGQPRVLITLDRDGDGDGVLDISDPCDCNDSQNIVQQTSNIVYFHDVLTICGVVSKQNVYLKDNNQFLDQNLNPVLVGTNLGTPNTNGCVIYDFWHESGKQASISIESSAGPKGNYMSSICNRESCIQEIVIPTFSSWGVFILGLLMLNLCLFFMLKMKFN